MAFLLMHHMLQVGGCGLCFMTNVSAGTMEAATHFEPGELLHHAYL